METVMYDTRRSLSYDTQESLGMLDHFIAAAIFSLGLPRSGCCRSSQFRECLDNQRTHDSLDDSELLPHFPERRDRFVEVGLRVRRGQLASHTGLTLRHHGIPEAGDEDALIEPP